MENSKINVKAIILTAIIMVGIVIGSTLVMTVVKTKTADAWLTPAKVWYEKYELTEYAKENSFDYQFFKSYCENLRKKGVYLNDEEIMERYHERHNK